MKIGSLVQYAGKLISGPNDIGIVVDLIEKKCWRTSFNGPTVDWSAVEPEPHAVVMYSDERTVTIPAIELREINEE